MRLGDIAVIKTNFEEADFWVVRRGCEHKVGSVVREFSKYNIGVYIEYRYSYSPVYVSYLVETVWIQGWWKSKSKGTLRLQHITVDQVKSIPLI